MNYEIYSGCILKIGAVPFSETSLIYHATWNNIPEDNYTHGNLKSHTAINLNTKLKCIVCSVNVFVHKLKHCNCDFKRWNELWHDSDINKVVTGLA